jgi:hypothetical protein
MVAQRARAAAVPDRARVRHRRPADQHASRQHRSRPGLLGRRPNRSTVRQPIGTRSVPVVTGARRTDLGPMPPPGMGADGHIRTDGADTSRLDAGRVDTRGLDTGRVDSRRPDRRTPGRRTQVTGHWTGWIPNGWTAGSRTTIPDGCTPDAGHRLATDAMAGVLAVSTRATMPDRWMSAGRSAGRRCLGEQQPRRSAAGATPPSSWRLGALLSSDDFGSSVERRGACHPVYGDEWEGSVLGANR